MKYNDILSGRFLKFFFGSGGSVFAFLLFGKNLLGVDTITSVKLSVFFAFLLLVFRFLWYLVKDFAVTVHDAFVESVWGEAIRLLKDAYADIHYLRSKNFTDEEFQVAMTGMCDKLKQIFDKKTKGNCSVSIKVPVSMNGNLESLTMRNLCRDSKHLFRNTEQYASTQHTVIGNTAYLEVVRNITRGSTKLAFINNDINSYKNYANTSKECYENGIFPYQSELVYPIRTIKSERRNQEMCGFLCVDCDKKNAFDERGYDVPMVEGVVDGIYDIILRRIMTNHQNGNQ